MNVSVLIRRITPVVLAVALLSGAVALATVASADPVASAAKSKCKKKKKSKKSAAAAKKKKKKRCGGGGSGGGAGGSTLPGSPTHPTAVPPTGPGSTAPLQMSDLTLTNGTVLGGTGTQGQVTISGPAPSGGQTVDLQSSDPNRASVPSSVQVAAGQTTALFPVTTTAGPDVGVVITASIDSSSANASLTVVQDPSVDSLTLDHQCYPDTGSFNANRVTLDVPTPVDEQVALLSSSPLALSVLPFVTVPQGSSSALFPVVALTADPAVTVTATLNSTSANDTASVRDVTSPAPVVTGLSLNPTSVQAGNSSVGTVTLDCEALAGGSTVSLSSDNADVTVPPTVTVAQDSLTATFSIATSPTTTDADAVITATLGNVRQATLTIDNLGT